jgi:hypothetical protein
VCATRADAGLRALWEREEQQRGEQDREALWVGAGQREGWPWLTLSRKCNTVKAHALLQLPVVSLPLDAVTRSLRVCPYDAPKPAIRGQAAPRRTGAGLLRIHSEKDTFNDNKLEKRE